MSNVIHQMIQGVLSEMAARNKDKDIALVAKWFLHKHQKGEDAMSQAAFAKKAGIDQASFNRLAKIHRDDALASLQGKGHDAQKVKASITPKYRTGRPSSKSDEEWHDIVADFNQMREKDPDWSYYAHAKRHSISSIDTLKAKVGELLGKIKKAGETKRARVAGLAKARDVLATKRAAKKKKPDPEVSLPPPKHEIPEPIVMAPPPIRAPMSPHPSLPPTPHVAMPPETHIGAEYGLLGFAPTVGTSLRGQIHPPIHMQPPAPVPTVGMAHHPPLEVTHKVDPLATLDLWTRPYSHTTIEEPRAPEDVIRAHLQQPGPELPHHEPLRKQLAKVTGEKAPLRGWKFPERKPRVLLIGGTSSVPEWAKDRFELLVIDGTASGRMESSAYNKILKFHPDLILSNKQIRPTLREPVKTAADYIDKPYVHSFQGSWSQAFHTAADRYRLEWVTAASEENESLKDAIYDVIKNGSIHGAISDILRS
jgi:hypothetical protein